MVLQRIYYYVTKLEKKEWGIEKGKIDQFLKEVKWKSFKISVDIAQQNSKMTPLKYISRQSFSFELPDIS